MPFPHEITIMILRNLPKNFLKRARLVCKDLAVLGESLLLETIFVSPREKDMEVFEAITKKPGICSSVRRIVFDSAQFRRRTERTYFADLCQQLSQPQLRYLMMSNAEVATLVRDILGSTQENPSPQDLRQAASSSEAYERCQDNPAFNKGLELYHMYAKQQRRLVNRNWIEWVARGLRKLGDIDSVELAYTFNTTFFDSDAGLAATCLDKLVYNPNHVDDNTFVLTFSNPAILAALDHFRGTNTKGSPIARSWPATALYPSRAGFYYGVLTEDALRDDNISNGCVEFHALCIALSAASKFPLKFVAQGHDELAMGLPDYVFQATSDDRIQDISRRLKGLHLKIAPYLGKVSNHSAQGLPILKAYFHTLPALEELTLALPIEARKVQYSYKFEQLFPDIPTFQLDTLKRLELFGLSATYRELACLLFMAFPNMSKLRLGEIYSINQNWDHIVEGLRQAVENGLGTCELVGYFYVPTHFYTPGHAPIEMVMRDAKDINKELCDYIMNGGRHPGLRDHEPDGRSIQWRETLNKDLDVLRLLL